MATVFSTPAMSGFDKLDPHPKGGYFFGGAETAEAGIVEGIPTKLVFAFVILCFSAHLGSVGSGPFRSCCLALSLRDAVQNSFILDTEPTRAHL